MKKTQPLPKYPLGSSSVAALVLLLLIFTLVFMLRVNADILYRQLNYINPNYTTNDEFEMTKGCGTTFFDVYSNLSPLGRTILIFPFISTNFSEGEQMARKLANRGYYVRMIRYDSLSWLFHIYHHEFITRLLIHDVKVAIDLFKSTSMSISIGCFGYLLGASICLGGSTGTVYGIDSHVGTDPIPEIEFHVLFEPDSYLIKYSDLQKLNVPIFTTRDNYENVHDIVGKSRIYSANRHPVNLVISDAFI